MSFKEHDLKPKVVFIGETSIDKVYLPSKTKLEPKESPGGASAYSACASAFLGVFTGLVTKVGVDFPKKSLEGLQDILAPKGIRVEPGKTTRFEIHYSKDFKATYPNMFFDQRNRIRPTDIPNEYLAAEMFHICPLPGEKGTWKGRVIQQEKFFNFLENSSSCLLSVSTGQEIIKRERKKVLDLSLRTDFFFLNQQEALSLTEKQDLDDAGCLLSETGSIINITLGEKGSVTFKDEKKVAECKAIPTKIVDPTGAGDSFCGAFLASWVKEKDKNLKKAAENGNLVSSKTIRSPGLMSLLDPESLPRAQE